MKHLLISLFLIIPALLFSQDKSANNKFDAKNEPVLSVFTNLFKVKSLNFSKTQPNEKGELLEIDFQLQNNTNVSMDLYIFVIATYEKEYAPQKSFEKPDFQDRTLIKLINTSPEDLTNFEYTEKESTGEEKKIYKKYPKNIKAGIDKKTGKPYNLNELLTFRSLHMSTFNKNYYFFNTVAILIFDSDEKLIFRQNYRVKPVKR